MKQHGLNHIEWVITKKSFETNPLFSKDFDKGNLPISSICADNLVDKRIFMRPFLEKNLTPICDAAITHDIKFVTIPLLERYIDLIFHKINNVHLKDRTRQGGSRSLPPSEGDTNFELIFAKLKELGYNKLYTLQTARGPFGEEASTILRHRDILQEIYDGA